MTRSTKFRLLAAVAVMVGLLAPLLGPAATPASAVADVQVVRLGGADRFATAAEVARESHPGAETALIANGLNFPDAIAGSTLAGALNAPILLVATNSIPPVTSEALQELGVNDVVILGGPNAVSPSVEAELRQRYGVTRVAGDDRFKTAVEIARRAAVGGIGTIDGLRSAFVSTGLNFPDALGAGPLAYEGDLPSFLTRTNDLPAEVAQAIRDLNIEHVVILGGTQAVSATVEAQIEAIGVSTERLNGRNRAETATFVADFALARMSFEGVNTILARGDNFPDALAGGPLGGERRAVILLTATPCQLAIETRLWLEDHFGTVARIFVLGGQSAVCDAVAREAEQAAETNNLPPSEVALTISGGSMNGGPHWQYQQSGASPSKSLTLSALVTSDPPEGSDADADRVPAAREDVIFNIRPTTGDDPANTEINLTGRTDSNGVARVTYTRAEPGTDIITVRLRDDTSVMDDGVGRWNTDEMPMSLTPDTSQNLDVNQPRAFTVCVPGPEGAAPTLEGQEVNLTTLELVDDNPDNDTNVGALRFSADVEDDRGDNDQTVGKVTTRAADNASDSPDGCADFTVSSNAAQIFTLMAFIDSVDEPATNDDNTNPPEYRDIAGVTVFGASSAGLNIIPPNDGEVIARRNGQQIVYTVSAVDAQGQPISGAVDVSFAQLVDGQAATTTTAELDWYDNSATPSSQEGTENQVPPGATPLGAGTTRFQAVPNAEGEFTFAVVHPQSRINPTTGNPIAWIDITGGVNNRPDAAEPQAQGRTFSYNAGTFLTATLESLGCPPGTDQRGYPGGNNPFEEPDPCLGMDQSLDPNDPPHVPWPLEVAAESTEANAATRSETVDPTEAGPRDLPPPTPNISRGDIVFRLTLRGPDGRPLRDDPFTTSTDEGASDVQFEITTTGGSGSSSAAPNRPNPGSQNAAQYPDPTGPVGHLVDMTTSEGVAEVVVDRTVNDRRESSSGAEFNGVVVSVIVESNTFIACTTGGEPISGDPDIVCEDTAQWAAIRTDTTKNLGQHDGTAAYAAPITEVAPPTQCPSLDQPCFNGTVTGIDKARDYYVMNRGANLGGQAYVVYAIGGGGEEYPAGERTGGIDEYFIDGVRAASEPGLDDSRCGVFASFTQLGCARFDAALSYDDRMVYEFSGTAPARTQTHFLTNGEAPTE